MRSIAATEVGYIGARFSSLVVIDMAGLNDREIAYHGFSSKSVLARRPDIVWLPHTHYRGMRRELLCDPTLFDEYDVFPSVYDFGIALRRDTPFANGVKTALARDVEQVYGGRVPLSQQFEVDSTCTDNGTIRRSRPGESSHIKKRILG
jgi:hypothetical protein